MMIEYTNWGMANRIGNTVILNKNLKKHPWLHDILLKHELSHSSNASPLKNVLIDVGSVKQSSKKEWFEKLKFILCHPGTLVQASPIWIYKGKVYFDLSMSLAFIALSILSLFAWLLKRYL